LEGLRELTGQNCKFRRFPALACADNPAVKAIVYENSRVSAAGILDVINGKIRLACAILAVERRDIVLHAEGHFLPSFT
jgi:hypothetical protein